MRQTSWANILLSLLNISPGQIAGILGSAGIMILLAWDYVGLIALRTGPIAYVFAILIALICGIGVVATALFIRGDLAWRRQVIAQMQQIRSDEFRAIKEKYIRLITEVTRYNADQKQHEPTHAAGVSKEEWQKQAAEHAKYRNESEAKFIERFSPQIIDLTIGLKRAGAIDRHISAPVWAWVQWPDKYLEAAGNEIARLESVYNETLHE